MNILMSYGADFLVILASLGAMAYCMVLSRRLSRLTSFDKGLGGAIAVMSAQVDEMKAVLLEAKAGSDGAENQLNNLVHQARDISSELEMMIAACHDFAEEAISVQAPTGEAQVAPDLSPEKEDSVPTEADMVENSAAPRFSLRRSTPKLEEEASASVEPLFGRRKLTAG